MTDFYQNNSLQRDFYSDFLCDLNSHPNTKDVVRSTDALSVKRSIKNLILTRKNERLYSPDIGSSVADLLFENMTFGLEEQIKKSIYDVIGKYEPRCILNDVIVIPDDANNRYVVKIIFSTINNQVTSVLEVSLYRVR